VIGDEVLLAIASDGAGSASCSEEGSGLACETLARELEQWHRNGGACEAVDRELVEQWIDCIRRAIESRSAERELTPRDFACTLVGAVVGCNAAAFFQIGDGAIIARREDALDVLFWPDGGEYANMTYFLTDDDWRRHLHVDIVPRRIDELALMTDGLQRLALNFDSRSPHGPFFEPMFGALRCAPPGFAAALEPSLTAFLGSEAVNARTDDDKSLVLATRRSGAADGPL